MEYKERVRTMIAAEEIGREHLIYRTLYYKKEAEHEGYMNMVKAYNKIIGLKKKVQSSFKTEWKNNLPYYRSLIPLTEVAEILKEIEEAQKEYDQIPKFRVNIITRMNIEAV